MFILIKAEIFINQIYFIGKETCEDDPKWHDTKYGDGSDRCSTMTYELCNYPGNYSSEAKRACPKSCGVCSIGIPEYLVSKLVNTIISVQ